MSLRRVFCVLGCLSLAGAWLHAAEELPPPAAETTPAPAQAPWAELTLPDSAGQPRPLKDLRGERGLAVVFIGTECPVVQLYLPRLVELAPKLRERGIGFVAVDANVQDSAEELAGLVKEFGLPFVALRDAEGRLADALKATRTPEAILLDATGAIFYRGRIDDQFAPGVQRSAPSQQFLAEAAEALATGKPAPQAHSELVGCLIGRAKPEHLPIESAEPAAAEATAQVTYTEQIARVLNANCTACHREGDIAPFALTDYESAAAWGDTLLEAVDAGRMPPWPASPEHGRFLHERRLSPADRELLHQWVRAGCPQGDPADLPAASDLTQAEETFVPDVVYPISDKPFDVPAAGIVDYQYLAIDPGWKEDKWIARADVFPGERSVVHHVLVFVRRPGVKYQGVYPGDLICGFVPGLRNTDLPAGTAFHAPAGSTLVFQMHYTPTGVPRKDLSHVGLKFADPATVENVATTRRAINAMIQIPPRARNYEAVATYEFRRDATLLKLIPHMHVRGKSIRYEALYPNGQRETLLDVPRWDFNWQLEYVLAEPKLMPAGTLMLVTATYDNSKNNPANPDPTQWVMFGEQTWQEMLIGFFVASESTAAPDRPVEQLAGAVQRIVRRATAPQPADMGQQIEDWAQRGFDALQAARRMRRNKKQGTVIEEAEHVVVGGIREARKQGVLPTGDGRPPELVPGVPAPGLRLRRGQQFMGRAAGTLRELNADSEIRLVPVQPVPWPLPEEVVAPAQASATTP